MGTATPSRVHRRLGQCFASLLTYPWSSWEQGSHLPYTPTDRGLFAPVVAGDRRCAFGRVNSDRAVDHSRCEADQTSGIASPRGSLARLSSQVSRRKVRLLLSHTVDSTQRGRSVPAPWWFGQGHPGREVRPEREAVLEGGPHPTHRASLCAAVLPTSAPTRCHLRSGCKHHCQKTPFGAYVAGP